MHFSNPRDLLQKRFRYDGSQGSVKVKFVDGTGGEYNTYEFDVEDLMVDPTGSGRVIHYLCRHIGSGKTFEFLGPSMERWIQQDILELVNQGQPVEQTKKSNAPMQCEYCKRFSLLQGVCNDGEQHCKPACFKPAV